MNDVKQTHDKNHETLCNESKKPVTVIVIGAGERGKIYSEYALSFPHKMKVVGVADPLLSRRKQLMEKHHISHDKTFSDWREVFNREKFADAVIIATPDRLHVEPTLSAAEKGYHILLEKPMAPTEDGCYKIVEKVIESGIIFSVCHVLRYTRFSRVLKEVIDSGEIGDIVSIQHLEPVGYWHQAHSFVRGNWRRSDNSSSMLLAKSCHDVDWIRFIMGKKCNMVASFGYLSHFRQDRRPIKAAQKCVDCPEDIESECPYSALKIYRGFLDKDVNGWPLDVLTENVDINGLEEAIRNGPYGRCVYACDNDAVDNQVTIMSFEGGRTASFTMTAFTDATPRKTKLFGTKGEIDTDSRYIHIFNFLKGQWTTIDTVSDEKDLMGHGGGDLAVIKNFIDAILNNDSSRILTGSLETLESHLIVFAAEKSRYFNKIMPVGVE